MIKINLIKTSWSWILSSGHLWLPGLSILLFCDLVRGQATTKHMINLVSLSQCWKSVDCLKFDPGLVGFGFEVTAVLFLLYFNSFSLSLCQASLFWDLLANWLIRRWRKCTTCSANDFSWRMKSDDAEAPALKFLISCCFHMCATFCWYAHPYVTFIEKYATNTEYSFCRRWSYDFFPVCT